jgi:hypothetical protein
MQWMDYTTLSTAALRDFNRLNVRFGSTADAASSGDMSALPLKADIVRLARYVRLVP